MALVRLGSFSLEEEVGRGGAGVVWRARHDTGATAAVKVLLGHHHDRTWRRSFAREIRTVAALTHPGIVPVLDAGEVPAGLGDGWVPGSPWLAMGWVEHTLAEWVGPDAHRTWPEVRRVLLELLAALAHAHAHGVSHLDVKPENVLITADGAVRLSDFGVASWDGASISITADAAGAGTPLFMAPEQFFGEGGPASDLYAIGCLTWWLVTGRPPFDRPLAELPYAHILEPPPPLELPEGWPGGLAAWTDALLAKAPEARFERAADAAWALRSLGEGGESAPAVLPSRGAAASDTWVPDELELPERPPAADAAPPSTHPPLPEAWHEPPTTAHLAGAGLGLFGLRTIPLVDRAREREALWSALAEVHREGRPRLITLVGPPGVGKSRLARALASHAHAVGAAEVLSATHGPAGGSGHGLVPMAARWLALRPPVSAEALARRLPEASDERISALARALREEPVRAEDRDAIGLEVVRHASRRRPVVLLLDDVQWGPEARRLAGRVLGSALPVLVVATVRLPAAEVLADLPPGQRLDLEPLEPRHSADLARSLLGVTSAVAARIATRSQGVPLFAIQLVRDWVQRGVLEPRGDGLVLSPGTQVSVPDDLHGVWLDQLEQLPVGVADALEVGATLGGLVQTATWRAACAAAGVTPTGLDAAGQQGLITVDGQSWRFRYGLLRESLERRCRDAGRWVSTHAACAEALEGATHPDTLARRARHLHESGDLAAAVRLGATASAALFDLGDFDSAGEVLEAVAPGLDGVDAATRIEVRLSLANLALHRGRFQACVDACTRLLGELTEPTQRAQALLRRANALHLLGELEQSDDDAERARRLLEGTGRAEQEGDASFQLALNASGRADFEDAEAHLQRADAVWRSADGPAVWFRWLDWARADIAVARHDLDRATALARTASEGFEQAGLLWQAILARGLVAEVHLARQEHDDARRILDGCRADALALGVKGAPILMTHAAWSLNEVLAGRADVARETLEHVCAALKAAGWRRSGSGPWLGLVLCRLEAGDAEGAEEALAEAEASTAARQVPDRSVMPIAAHAGSMLDAAGRGDLARRCRALGRVHTARMSGRPAG